MKNNGSTVVTLVKAKINGRYISANYAKQRVSEVTTEECIRVGDFIILCALLFVL